MASARERTIPTDTPTNIKDRYAKNNKTFRKMGSGLLYEEQQIRAKQMLNTALGSLVPRHQLGQTQATDDYK